MMYQQSTEERLYLLVPFMALQHLSRCILNKELHIFFPPAPA